MFSTRYTARGSSTCFRSGCDWKTLSPPGAANVGDEIHLHQLARICKHRIGVRDLQRRYFVGSQRDRRSRFDVHVQPRRARHLRHLLIADHLRDFHRRDVPGVDQRLAQRHGAVIFLVVILRLVGLVVEPERGRFVLHRGCGSKHHRALLSRPVIIAAVYTKGLNDDPGWRFGKSVIQLAGAVIPAADQGLDFPGLRIQHDHGHLRLRHFIGAIFLGPPLPLRIGFLNADPHRLHRIALQIHIQRRIHAIRPVLEIAILKLGLQRVVHHVDEVRRVAGFHNFMVDAQRRRGRLGVLLVRNLAVVPHGLQH